MEEEAQRRALNALLLSHAGSAEELSVVHESNPACVKLASAEGPRAIGPEIAVLSWRWDLIKLPSTTLEEAKRMRSDKIVRFIELARARGFRWAWVDWCVIPQFTGEKAELMMHVVGSRALYQKASVFVLDVEEVWPGLSVPTLGFQTRLWIAAEKSAVLSNPHVSIATYVQVSRVNHMTIALATQGEWTSANHTLEGYHDFLQDTEGHVSYLRAQSSLNFLLYNIGRALIEERYPGLAAFLTSGLMLDFEDKRHLTEEPPIDVAAQEELIKSYWKEEAGVTPGAVVRTPMGASHPRVAALLAEASASEQMAASFSHHAHYEAILLLASEVFYWQQATARFDPNIFETLTIALGKHPTKPAPPEDAPYSLKAFLRSDFEVVAQMMFDGEQGVLPPATYTGVELPMVPDSHEFTVPFELASPFSEALNDLRMNPVDRASNPASSPISVSVTCSLYQGGGQGSFSNIDINGQAVRITLSQAGPEQSSLVMTANSSYKPSVTEGGVTLAPEQVWFMVSLSLTDSETFQTQSALVRHAARGVDSDSVRKVWEGVAPLVSSVGTLAQDNMRNQILDITSSAGIVMDI